jgi:hypothetical protein
LANDLIALAVITTFGRGLEFSAKIIKSPWRRCRLKVNALGLWQTIRSKPGATCSSVPYWNCMAREKGGVFCGSLWFGIQGSLALRIPRRRKLWLRAPFVNAKL